MGEDTQLSAGRFVYRTIMVFVAMAGLACALTLVFLSMRAVMRIGGTCASGGPFEIRSPCTKGIPGLMIGSIWGGLVFAAVYAYQSSRAAGPGGLVKLAWPALFLSLGYNFLEFGIHPPGEVGGLQWGWLIPGVLFVIMGGVPLLMGISFALSDRRDEARKRAASPVPSSTTSPAAWPGSSFGTPSQVSTGTGSFTWPSATPPATPPAVLPAAPTSADVVSRLERLADLHGRGELTDEEYESAKKSVLRGRG